MSKYLTATLIFLLAFLGVSEPAFADNCGSLSDCYEVALAAAIAGVAIPILISILLDFSPVGRLRAILEAILGRDVLTGARLAWWERLLNLIPGGRSAGRAARAANAVDEARDVVRGADAARSAQRSFSSQEKLLGHFEKHGHEFGFRTPEEYLAGARNLTKGGEGIQTFNRSNGDKLFYNPGTNEFGVLNRDGNIRTYFKPSRGLEYWLDQIS